MSQAHALTLNRQLGITLNGLPIKQNTQELFVSKNLKPAYLEKSYASKALTGKTGPPVRVKLYAGVSERSLHDGGWYLFCNGRLVLSADQTPTTVWGERHQVRAYHPDFAYFRGYAMSTAMTVPYYHGRRQRQASTLTRPSIRWSSGK